MKKYLFTVLIAGTFCPFAAFGQDPAPGKKLQASNLLNPNVSVIGWLQAEAGRRNPPSPGADSAAFALKEAEIGLQSMVDPYARADVFIGVGGEGTVELEEGTLDWFSLPYGLGLKAGKFRGSFGKFNRTHVPETAFADRPLVHESFFGEEGLSAPGVSLSWHVPNPWLFLDWTVEAMNNPEAAEVPAFDKARKRDLLYVSRLGAYYDLSESINAAAGASGALGAAGQDYDAAANSTATLNSRLFGLDMTFRWKDPRKAIYRSALWQTEVLWSKRDIAGGSAAGSWGMFTHAQYQFARRWRFGGRYDYAQTPADGKLHEAGGLAYLTFTPSEFSLLSLQGRRARRTDGSIETLGWLKVTFNIGPHGAHPF